MPIIHYPGYITREEEALRQKVQVRAINDQVKRNAIEFLRVDGFVYIKDTNASIPTSSPIVSPAKLRRLPRVARKNKFIPERLYEEVIVGKVTGVVVVDHVFVIEDEPALVNFLQTVYKRDVRVWNLKEGKPTGSLRIYECGCALIYPCYVSINTYLNCGCNTFETMKTYSKYGCNTFTSIHTYLNCD